MLSGCPQLLAPPHPLAAVMLLHRLQYALYEYLVKVRMAVRRQQLRRQHGKAAGESGALGVGSWLHDANHTLMRCACSPGPNTPTPCPAHPTTRALSCTRAVLPAVHASALEVFVLSALAKAGATVVTYPLLTIKTRMYMARKGDKDMQYAGIADAAVQILRKEGGCCTSGPPCPALPCVAGLRLSG